MAQPKIRVIFTGDKEPRILQVLKDLSEDKSWEIANLMASAPECDFIHYDILPFESIEEAMNFFVAEGRKYQKEFNVEIH